MAGAAAIGCSGTDPQAPGGLPPQPAPLPVAFEWLGSYTGSMHGNDRGAGFADVSVTLTMALSTTEACPERSASDAVTVKLQTTDSAILFGHCNLRVTQPSDARFEYTDAGRRHILSIGRFSGGGGTANVILGEVSIQEPGASGEFETVFVGIFTVERW